MLNITFNDLLKSNTSPKTLHQIVNYLRETDTDVEDLNLEKIIDAIGFQDFLDDCLPSYLGHEKEFRLFAIWVIDQAQSPLEDIRLRDILDVARRFANGQATEDELAVAKVRAGDIVKKSFHSNNLFFTDLAMAVETCTFNLKNWPSYPVRSAVFYTHRINNMEDLKKEFIRIFG